jgi:metal-responsive CopG/Arc/MetJ family transcriptional regulator
MGAARRIHVSLEDALVRRLDQVAKKERKNRSTVIRQACTQFVERKTEPELDAAYETGYKRYPEEPAIGDIQVALATQVLAKETW